MFSLHLIYQDFNNKIKILKTKNNVDDIKPILVSKNDSNIVYMMWKNTINKNKNLNKKTLIHLYKNMMEDQKIPTLTPEDITKLYKAVQEHKKLNNFDSLIKYIYTRIEDYSDQQFQIIYRKEIEPECYFHPQTTNLISYFIYAMSDDTYNITQSQHPKKYCNYTSLKINARVGFQETSTIEYTKLKNILKIKIDPNSVEKQKLQKNDVIIYLNDEGMLQTYKQNKIKTQNYYVGNLDTKENIIKLFKVQGFNDDNHKKYLKMLLLLRNFNTLNKNTIKAKFEVRQGILSSVLSRFIRRPSKGGGLNVKQHDSKINLYIVYKRKDKPDVEINAYLQNDNEQLIDVNVVYLQPDKEEFIYHNKHYEVIQKSALQKEMKTSGIVLTPCPEKWLDKLSKYINDNIRSL